MTQLRIRAVAVCAGTTIALAPGAARAGDWGPENIGPDPTHVFEGPHELVATGAPMVSCVPGGMGLGLGGSACTALPSQQWNVGGFPVAGRFERAWMIWSHSKEPADPIDTTLTLTLPGGAATPLQADAVAECRLYEDVLRGAEAELLGLDGQETGWATCRHDVTAVLNAHLAAGREINGPWEASGLDIADERMIDTLLGPVNFWHLISLVVGSVTFVGVLTPDTPTPHRKLYIYNGFRFIEGPGTFDISVSGFLAPPEPRAAVLVHVLEGDVDLVGDQLKFNGEALTDGCNPGNNVWNGTINVGRADGGCLSDAEGTDLDRYDVSRLIRRRDTTAALRLVVPGEQLITNFLALQIDSVPEFIKPTKGAEPRPNTPVGLGDVIAYEIGVLIGGDADAEDVVITDAVPDGTRYVPGSARINGEAVPHPAGEAASPLALGLPVSEILGEPLRIGDRHVVTFEACAIAEPRGGSFVNVARLQARGVDPVDTNPVVHPFLGGGDAADCDRLGEGEGEPPAEGEGEPPAEGEGEPPAEGEGEVDGEGEGDGGGEAPGGPVCGPGTHRDGATGQCISDCGPGTTFDALTGRCVPSPTAGAGGGGGGGGRSRRDGCAVGAGAGSDPRWPWWRLRR